MKLIDTLIDSQRDTRVHAYRDSTLFAEDEKCRDRLFFENDIFYCASIFSSQSKDSPKSGEKSNHDALDAKQFNSVSMPKKS